MGYQIIVNGMTRQAWRLEARRRSRYQIKTRGRGRGFHVIPQIRVFGFWAQKFNREYLLVKGAKVL